MKNFLWFFIIATCCAACNNNTQTAEDSDYSVNQDTIQIIDNAPLLNKLEKQKVRIRPYSREIITSGTVKAIPNNYALIAAPFAGRITKSYVHLGQYVHAGDPIFEISSPSFFETGKAYYQAKEEMDFADKNRKRQNDLFSKGVGIERDLEEAEVNYLLKKKDFENSLASLKVYQVDTTNLILGHPLVVRSPISGTIVENNIVIGQYLREDSEPVATVAELSKVWVAGQVKEKDIRYITDSTKVKITLIAFPEKEILGYIYHINSVIDEDTRSINVLIECENRDRIMKPGMYVTVSYRLDIVNSMVIPSTAIFQMENTSYVFLGNGKNRFVKQRIEILSESEDSAIVKSGLNADDEIIIKGGFYLLEEK